MIIRRIFSFLIVLFLVFFDRNFSFSKQGTKAISFDSSIEAVSHRISNNLSDCIETERADRLINRFLAKWEVAGATVAVVKDQKLLFAKGYGFADIEKEIEVELLGLQEVTKGVISLQNDNDTEYQTYLMVQNELQRAYNELRNDLAKRKFGKVYDELGKDEQAAIREVYPQKISEAEPKNIGGK